MAVSMGDEDSNRLVIDFIYQEVDHGRCCGVLFLDLRKAFDKVDHQILIAKKLWNPKFRGKLDHFIFVKEISSNQSKQR